MDNHGGSIKVHVHYSLRDEILKEIGDLRKEVSKMAPLIDKLAAKDNLKQKLKL